MVCDTTNVGFDQYGFAHPRGDATGTALRQCLDEADEVDAHIVAVQEHKLGKHDHGYILELKANDKREWLGFPGDKKREAWARIPPPKGSGCACKAQRQHT